MKPVEKRKTYCQSCIWFQWHCKYIHSKNCAPTANSASDPVDIATERKRMHTDCLTTHLRLYTSMLWSTQYSSHIQCSYWRESSSSDHSALSSCHNNCQQSRVYLCGDDLVMLYCPSSLPFFIQFIEWSLFGVSKLSWNRPNNHLPAGKLCLELWPLAVSFQGTRRWTCEIKVPIYIYIYMYSINCRNSCIYSWVSCLCMQCGELCTACSMTPHDLGMCAFKERKISGHWLYSLANFSNHRSN